ncbi:META domain-containing protein [Psychroflexus halocasei]|uniref:Heat shock protein HslJ n=1 Tax=Psychroflexus halocasei TaxID=908615 RepID=A0A1H3W092_9FLAO|nr:META domain-containing protein [Psychroflexus halocasei]SDZ80476.1 Heat shock protein HslJ [Psychroflexus halocasei]
MRLIKAVFLFCLLGLAVSCQVGQSAASSKKLKSDDFKIVKLGQKDVSEADLDLSISSKDAKIYGFGGCNNYSFNYAITDGRIDLGHGVSTKKYCAKQMENENLLFQLAAKISTFQQTEKEIIFKNDKGETLIKAQKQ